MNQKQLMLYVKQFRYGMLGRKKGSKYCYMVCWPLSGSLNFLGVKNDLIEGEVYYYGYWIGHFWVRLANGKIIDPTAGQFSTGKRPMPTVYIGKKPRWYRAK